jgi:hypothetical protein
MATNETWTDPDRCPFCGGALSSPGVGFIAHIEERPECRAAFDTWRDRVGEDVVGGWSG